MGDPNRNGVFGHDLGGSMVVPGDLERSYLYGRLFGLVPGTRMPLGNQPLDEAEHLAVICWIETLDDDPDVFDPIDYDACDEAAEAIETGAFVPPEAESEP